MSACSLVARLLVATVWSLAGSARDGSEQGSSQTARLLNNAFRVLNEDCKVVKDVAEDTSKTDDQSNDNALVHKLSKCVDSIHEFRKLATQSQHQSMQHNQEYANVMSKTVGMLAEILDKKQKLAKFTKTVASDQEAAEKRLGSRVSSIVSELEAWSKAAEDFHAESNNKKAVKAEETDGVEEDTETANGNKADSFLEENKERVKMMSHNAQKAKHLTRQEKKHKKRKDIWKQKGHSFAEQRSSSQKIPLVVVAEETQKDADKDSLRSSYRDTADDGFSAAFGNGGRIEHWTEKDLASED